MLYLVHLLVDAEINDGWRAWMLDVHVGDVLATGCFASAWATREPERDAAGRVAWTMAYLAHDEAAWDRYAADHAPALQADHTSRFGGHVEASRQRLRVERAWPAR